MPKAKTHKGTAKRVRKTGSGKLMVEAAGGGHLRSKKRASTKRRYIKKLPLHSTVEKTIKKLLP